MRVPALVGATTLRALAAGLAVQSARSAVDARAAFHAQLAVDAQHAETLLAESFERSRALTLLVARDPSPGALAFVDTVLPDATGSVCLLDLQGAARSCAAGGDVVPPSDLPPDQRRAPYFAPVRTLAPGQVFQSRPWRSTASDDWVITNATPVARGGDVVGVVTVDVLLESLRLDALRAEDTDTVVRVVAAGSGRVVLDSRFPPGTSGGRDHTFRGRVRGLAGTDSGALRLGDRDGAYLRLRVSGSLPGVNDNDWLVVASAAAPRSALRSALTPVTLLLLLAALALLGAALSAQQNLERRRVAEAARTRDERDALASQLSEMSEALGRASAATSRSGSRSPTCATRPWPGSPGRSTTPCSSCACWSGTHSPPATS